ncbi:hypothetical protein MRB53_030292 [Persea americana]|uniref:Uncharacterized protein n=1 Tax=Persea americana TaxID=3435 RepID=A0ACC2KLF4_PERAE|nr:hypothetical protein MRB53_030292 [Persea americana]
MQAETVDPSINKNVVLVDEFQTTVDSEETTTELPIQPSEVQGTSSATPVAIEGSAYNVDSPIVPQTPDDASFKFAPSLCLLKEQKETVKIMLHGITQTLTSGNLSQLAYCQRAANNIFCMNWAPLNIRSLRAIFDELFAYLESLKDLHNLGPAALFRQEVRQRLTNLRAQVEIRRQELDIFITTQDETLAALTTLRGSIERTRSMLLT